MFFGSGMEDKKKMFTRIQARRLEAMEAIIIIDDDDNQQHTTWTKGHVRNLNTGART